MFIVSTKRFKVKKKDGSVVVIPKEFVGEIPDEFKDEWLIQAAIKDGSIRTPSSKADHVIDDEVKKGRQKAIDAQAAKEAKVNRESKKKESEEGR